MCRRRQERHAPAVARHDGAPFQTLSARERFRRRRTIDRDLEDMAAIDIARVRAGVRAIDEKLSIRRDGNVLHHERARREQRRLTAGARVVDRVQMRPPVFVRQKDETIVGGPMQVHAARGPRHRIDERRSALPRFESTGDDRPRLLQLHERRSRHTAASRLPDERDGAAVNRPHRRRVARRRRRRVPNRRRGIRVETDEAVIVAIRHERQRASVRRPDRRRARPFRKERLPGRLRTVDRRDPDPPILHERDTVAGGRERGLVAVVDEARLRAAARRNCPHLHFRLSRIRARIRLEISFRRPVGAVIASAHVNDRLAVG